MPDGAAPTPAELEKKAYTTLGRAANAMRAFVLMCRHNSDHCNADAKEKLTPFHSVSEPPIGLPAYVARIMKHTECGEDGVLLGLRLAGRYCRKAKMTPSVLCMHRLLLVSIVLAVKTHYDKFRSNRTAGKSGGLRIQELNLLEAAMYRGMRYQTMIFQCEVDNMCEGSDMGLGFLEKASPSGVIQSPAPGAPPLPDEVAHTFRNAFDGYLGADPNPDLNKHIEDFVAQCSRQALALREATERELAAAKAEGKAQGLNAEKLARVAGAGMFAVRSRIAANQGDDAHSVASSAAHSATSQQAAAVRFRARVLGIWNKDDDGDENSRSHGGTASEIGVSNGDSHGGVSSEAGSKPTPAPPSEPPSGRPSAAGSSKA